MSDDRVIAQLAPGIQLSVLNVLALLDEEIVWSTRLDVPGMPNLREARAAVAELITELRNAHEIIKLAMNDVPASEKSPWFLAINDAGLCGDDITRFHERKDLLARVSGAE